jgi:hypothetical protein
LIQQYKLEGGCLRLADFQEMVHKETDFQIALTELGILEESELENSNFGKMNADFDEGYKTKGKIRLK